MSYLCKHGSVFTSVSKRVDVPGNTWTPTRSKRLVEEPQSHCHLINNCAVVGGGLITHTPAAIYKLQPACKETAGSLPSGFQKKTPPPVLPTHLHLQAAWRSAAWLHSAASTSGRKMPSPHRWTSCQDSSAADRPRSPGCIAHRRVGCHYDLTRNNTVTKGYEWFLNLMIKPHRLYYKSNPHGYIKRHSSSCKVLRDKWCINHQILYYYTLDWGRKHLTGYKKTAKLYENTHFICQRLQKQDWQDWHECEESSNDCLFCQNDTRSA